MRAGARHGCVPRHVPGRARLCACRCGRRRAPRGDPAARDALPASRLAVHACALCGQSNRAAGIARSAKGASLRVKAMAAIQPTSAGGGGGMPVWHAVRGTLEAG